MEKFDNGWVNKKETYSKCPKCGKGELSNRVPQSAFYKYIIFWQAYKRYECFSCNTKIHIKQSVLTN